MQCFLSSKEQHNIITCEGRQFWQSTFLLQSCCPTTEKQQSVLKCVLVPVMWGIQRVLERLQMASAVSMHSPEWPLCHGMPHLLLSSKDLCQVSYPSFASMSA